MSNPIKHNTLFTSISSLIEESRQQVAVAVNATMSLLYWRIVNRINTELAGYAADKIYGKQIVATLWRQLEATYGNLFRRKTWGE